MLVGENLQFHHELPKTLQLLGSRRVYGWKTFSFPEESILVKHADCVTPIAAFEFDKGVSNIISNPPCIAVELSTILLNELTLDKSVVWLFTICNVFESLLNSIDNPYYNYLMFDIYLCLN